MPARSLTFLAAYDCWISAYDVPDLRVRIRRGRGRTLLAVGRPDEAFASLTEAIELADIDTLRRELQIEAVEAALAAKRYPRTEPLCQELLKASPDAAISLRLFDFLSFPDSRAQRLGSAPALLPKINPN